MPQRGGQAILVRNASPNDMLRLPDDSATTLDGDFTVEAFVQLESLNDNANVRVIVSQWDGDQKHPGWSLGVTSEKSRYEPRNLILQIVNAGGEYQVIPSGLRLALHKAYFVAVSFKADESAEGGATFYLKDLTDMDAPLQSAAVAHQVTGSCASKAPLVIGGRLGAAIHGWDGLIDEVRLAKSALKPDQLLYNEGDPKTLITGHWLLKEQPGFFKDSAGLQKDLLRVGASATSATSQPAATNVDAGLVDLCHVLLNSNEFLYVD